MKVIHIESGLGNQMLSYCEYIAMKQANPSDEVYIENVIFDIPECNEVICQWNGYELERIFGIHAPNVKDIVPADTWEHIMQDIRASRFWERNWNWPVHISNAFNNNGLQVENIRGDFESPEYVTKHIPNTKSLSYKLKNCLPALYLKRIKYRRPIPMEKLRCEDLLFVQSDKNLLTGQQLKFKLKASGLERIEKEVREAFTFPEIKDSKNKEGIEYIRSVNAVAIHARRGDLLGMNYSLYVTGYFKRAVKFIRQHTENPEFFIFCDPGSVSWATENANILGLNMKKDKVHFVDWNKGTESYRDMQLMAECKHQVITNSSFGWWGAWLNTNPDKITCSPNFRFNTTHTF